MGILYLGRDGLSRVEKRIAQGGGLDFGSGFAPVESDREKRNTLLILEGEASADPEGAVSILVLDILASDIVGVGKGQIGKAVVVAHACIIPFIGLGAR